MLIYLGSQASAAAATANTAKGLASNAASVASQALTAAQAASSGGSFSLPSGLYFGDSDARDRGGIAQGKPYVDQAGIVQVCQLPPAQYGYDILHAIPTDGFKGILVRSDDNGSGDITVETWVNFSGLGQQIVFDLGPSGQPYGNLYAGLNGGGRPYIQVQGQYYGSTGIVPPTGQWIHFGVQLQTYNSVFYVNLLYNGVPYNLGQFTKNSLNWGGYLMIGQHITCLLYTSDAADE